MSRLVLPTRSPRATEAAWVEADQTLRAAANECRPADAPSHAARALLLAAGVPAGFVADASGSLSAALALSAASLLAGAAIASRQRAMTP
jgi:hypothetical protein